MPLDPRHGLVVQGEDGNGGAKVLLHRVLVEPVRFVVPAVARKEVLRVRRVPELLVVDAGRDDDERDIPQLELMHNCLHVGDKSVKRHVLVVGRRRALAARVVRAKEDVSQLDLLRVRHRVVLRAQNRPHEWYAITRIVPAEPPVEQLQPSGVGVLERRPETELDLSARAGELVEGVLRDGVAEQEKRVVVGVRHRLGAPWRHCLVSCALCYDVPCRNEAAIHFNTFPHFPSFPHFFFPLSLSLLVDASAVGSPSKGQRDIISEGCSWWDRCLAAGRRAWQPERGSTVVAAAWQPDCRPQKRRRERSTGGGRRRISGT